MNNTVHPSSEPVTVESLHREMVELRQRVEDLEDLRDLEQAITENADQPPIPWETAKKDLDLE